MRKKRSFSRKKLYSEVVVTDTRGQVNKLLGINYSNSGIGIISFSPINIGEVFELEFTTSDETGLTPHKITAEVVHHYSVGEICVSGLQFRGVLEEEHEKLKCDQN